MYDVTLPLSPALARWPGDPAIEYTSLGDAITISRWTLGSHAGTHVDAPAHFFRDGASVDTLDPCLLLGPCRVLDIPDAPVITAELLAEYPLAGVERVLLRTRNSRQWEVDPTVFHRDFVGITAEAACLLLASGVKLVGTDGLSIDPYASTGAAHELLLGAGAIIVEGLALAQVPAGDYWLVCAPLRLQGADGAPARVWLLEEADLQGSTREA
ncbi:MAG TPA: cyclase family protein [Armatimonadota bacterium]|jgi:arylformamidase